MTARLCRPARRSAAAEVYVKDTEVLWILPKPEELREGGALLYVESKNIEMT